MKRGLQIALLSFVLFIFGCSQVSEPVEVPETIDCPTVECPTSDPVEIIKYVCSDDRIVDTKEECSAGTTDDTTQETKLYDPITTNEEGSYITKTTMTPGCDRGKNAMTLSFAIDTLADEINVQVKEDPSEEFKTVYTIKPGTSSANRFGVICDSCNSGDFQLDTNKQYLARLEFDLTSLFSVKQYSNEHVIDTRDTSKYLTKICSS